MTHVINQVRAAIVAELLNATAAAERVEGAFVYRINPDGLKRILVTTPSTEDAIDSDSEMERKITALIHLSMSGETSPDEVYNLAAEVEALLGLTDLGGLVKINNALTGTVSATDPDGETPVSVLTLTYQFILWTAANDAENVV